MNTKHTIEKNNSDDIIYFNLVLTNNKKVSSPASVIVNLPSDFLPPKEKYMVSIDRFTINGNSIPYFIFKDNAYFITLSYGATSVTKPLLYSTVVPLSNNNFIPNGIFSYQQFALIINEAYRNAFADLQLAVAPALNLANAPFVVYNTDNNKYQIYAEVGFYTETLPNPVLIYYNSELYYFFNNYLVEFISENALDKKDIRISVRDMGGNSNQRLISLVLYYLMDQEFTNPSSITEPQIISIFSNTLGINPENTVPVNTTTDLVNGNFNQGSIPLANLIADFAPNFSNSDIGQWRNIITYLPAYRRQHYRAPLPDSKTIDLSVFWANSIGQQNIFYIEPNGAMTIKFVFEKIKN